MSPNNNLLIDINSFFYKKKLILKDINLELKKGDFVGIFGPSGSGKSTFIKIIGSLLKPQGKIIFESKNIFDLNYKDLGIYRNQKLGFDFQENNLIENLTGEENIFLPQTIGKIKIDQSWVESLITKLQMKNIIEQKIQYMSGGEMSRISLIKALSTKPQILISDEPASSLDKNLKKIVYEILKEYSKNHICIVTSHDESLKHYLTQYYELENNTFQNIFHPNNK